MGRQSDVQAVLNEKKAMIMELKTDGWRSREISKKIKGPNFNPSSRQVSEQIRRWQAESRGKKREKESEEKKKQHADKKKDRRREKEQREKKQMDGLPPNFAIGQLGHLTSEYTSPVAMNTNNAALANHNEPLNQGNIALPYTFPENEAEEAAASFESWTSMDTPMLGLDYPEDPNSTWL